MNPKEIKNPILRILYCVDQTLQKGIKTVCLILVAAVVVVVLFQVFARYLFNFSFRWTEELSRLMTVYAALLGGVLGARRGELAKVEFLVDRLPKKLAVVLDYLCSLLIMLFCVIAIMGSIEVLRMVIEYNQLTPALRWPKWISYFSVTLSMSCLLFFTVISLIFKIAKVRDEKDDTLAGEGIV